MTLASAIDKPEFAAHVPSVISAPALATLQKLSDFEHEARLVVENDGEGSLSINDAKEIMPYLTDARRHSALVLQVMSTCAKVFKNST